MGFADQGRAQTMQSTDKSTAGESGATTGFGIKLMKQIAKGALDKNIFLSPASIEIALGMALEGAGGATREAMAKTLELGGQNPEQAGEALMRALPRQDAGASVTLSVANSLWARKGLSLIPDYVRAMQAHYSARVEALDFADPASADAINAWVKRETRDKIPTIVGAIPGNTALFLINAIYFKGKWQRPFDPAKTRPMPFHLLGGRAKLAPMMVRAGRFLQLQGEGFQAVSLPYGDGRISMMIFLPDPNSDLRTFLTALTPELWNQWMPQFGELSGDLSMPRFKMSYELSLGEPLKSLGMAVAFDPARADFTKIITPPPSAYISEVLHKTFVEVNEQGTEAAAATSVRMGLTSMARRRPFIMVVDRPFFCAIRDNQTGALLFMGAIVDP